MIGVHWFYLSHLHLKLRLEALFANSETKQEKMDRKKKGFAM